MIYDKLIEPMKAQVSISKVETMALNAAMHRFVFVLSDALDMVGGPDTHHGKRVALMAVACARALGWPAEQRERLFLCALIHDCGVSSHRLHCDLIAGLDGYDLEEHGRIGHDYLLEVPALKGLALPILHHHTPWSRLKRMRIDPAVRLIANLIQVADRLDAAVGRQVLAGTPLDRQAALAAVQAHRGTRFHPRLVDALTGLAGTDRFWEMLVPAEVERQIDREALGWEPATVDLAQLGALAALFGRLVDAKSPFTAQHSEGVARLAALLGAKLGLDRKTCAEIELAGLVHDLGKLAVPDEILDKPGPLTPQEWEVMRRHSLDTFRLVLRLVGSHPIASWAACHHETLRGDGYPFGIGAVDLPIETRILAVADIFQALAQHRPYRRSMTLVRVMEILEGMVADNRLDGRVVAALRDNLAECHGAACLDTDCLDGSTGIGATAAAGRAGPAPAGAGGRI